MVLGDKKIIKEVKRGNIVIDPFDESCVGSNSYDVHLGRTLATYNDEILDAKRPPDIKYFAIPDDGYILHPGEFYLGAIMEYTESPKYLPWIDGKSSIGRLGIWVHFTAGKGDVGFEGRWTLEIAVAKPVKVYAGMPFAQLTFFETTKINNKYNSKGTAKYNNRDPRPMPSMMWKNFSDRKHDLGQE